MTDNTPQLPEAWMDLIQGIAILAQHPGNETHPFHCEHDKLTVCADPAKFTEEEIQRLDELGFFIDEDEETFCSFRFGSA